MGNRIICIRYCRYAILLLVFTTCTCGAAAKQTVAVLDFESIGSEEHLGKAVAEIMRTELVGADRFRVVERAQIKQALQEQALQMSGATDTQNAVKIGKLLGADLIIVGSVVKIGNSYTVNSRMIDVKTGEAQLGRNATGTDLNLLTSLSRELIDGLFGTAKKRNGGDLPATIPAPPQAPTSSPQPAVNPPQTAALHPQATNDPGATTTWDFETGDLRGWESSGDAFNTQPTLGDNPTARRRGQPSQHQGNFWIGTFERRPNSGEPAGATQGDGPQGTLLSKPFVIRTPALSFLIGGGCNSSTVHVDLLVNHQVVRSATGLCDETMHRERWEISQWLGATGRIRVADLGSGGWDHINFDDLRFEEKSPIATPPSPSGTGITWDFEDPQLPGWERKGDAFLHQPTYGDNPTARRRGQASNHQGNFWIGSFENRPTPASPPGGIQGDEPQGELISKPFFIQSETISFLIGGGCQAERNHVELRVAGRSAMRVTGACSETMHRLRWNVAHLRGQQATIHIVDRSSEGWGHINVDDFRFE
ncbi:MAG: CsgG/HfaB family protein [Pseudomonadota bacterium]